jgi:quercetin dioxygenase-like cupin family protein
MTASLYLGRVKAHTLVFSPIRKETPMKRMVGMLTVTLAVGIVVGLIGNHVLIAQQEPVKRTVLLNRTELAGIEGKEGLVYLIEVAPGATVPKHFHPGHELAYLLEGALTLEVEGKPSATLKAGDVEHLPPKVVHSGKNASTTTPAKFVVFGVYEKGQPDITLVK